MGWEATAPLSSHSRQAARGGDGSSPFSLSEKVINVVARTGHIPLETITLETTFDELGVDSLDTLTIVFALEEEFDINIPDEALREIRTVRQVVEELEKLVAAKKQ